MTVTGVLESMATHKPLLDDLQRGITLLAKLVTEGGLLIALITVPRFRDLCGTFLLQHVERVTINPLDLNHVRSAEHCGRVPSVRGPLGLVNRPEDQREQTAACLWEPC